MAGIIISLLGFFVFLYTLYLYVQEDFVLMRKNVTTSQVFDLTFLGMLWSLLIARIFFVAAKPFGMYLNPLVFFLVPYFPGLSFAGGILGGILFLWIYSRQKKLPAMRILDSIALSLVLGSGVYSSIFGVLEILRRHSDGIVYIVMAVFLLLLFWLLSNLYQKGKLTDGSIGLNSILLLSLIFLGGHEFMLWMTKTYLDADSIYWIVVIIVSFAISFKK